jgi:hypothetical protein
MAARRRRGLLAPHPLGDGDEFQPFAEFDERAHEAARFIDVLDRR